MAKSLKAKITDALKEAVGASARIELESISERRVRGLVLSRSFARQTPVERQDRIWKHLDEHLSLSERRRVTFIMTDTPEEYRAIMEADA